MTAGVVAHLSAARPVRALDYDPCPGDVAGVRVLVAALRGRGELLRQVVAVISGWQPACWRGPAAATAAARAGRLAEEVGLLQTSLEAAADRLEQWAGRLEQLQAEADRLDAEAVHNRRRYAEAGPDARALHLDATTGLDLRAAAERDRLQAELRLIKDRAGRLHQDYVGAAVRQAHELDAAAPGGAAGTGWFATVWDGTHDGWRHGVRRSARVHDWYAATTAHAASAAGAVAVVLPATAPVAVPVAAGLAGSSTVSRVALAAGAGGSTDAVVGGVAGTGLSAFGLVRAVGPVGHLVQDTATAGGVSLEVGSWAPGRPGTRTTTVVPGVDGSEIAVTVHDVAEPWQVGAGVRGHGFAGVATVPTTVPRQAPTSPVPAPPARPSPAPASPALASPATAPPPSASRVPRSGSSPAAGPADRAAGGPGEHP